jgi:hypothetical protein
MHHAITDARDHRYHLIVAWEHKIYGFERITHFF